MTDKGKEKLLIAVISIVLTAALSIPGTLIASKPSLTQNIIQLPDGQTVNADEIAALQSENAALRDSLAAQTNAALSNAAQPTTGPTTTKAPATQHFIDIAPPHDAFHANCYSVLDISDRRFFVQAGDSFVMSGKKYYNGIVWLGGTDWDREEPYSIHLLDGKYTRLEGTLGHIDGTQSKDSSLLIYYDGVFKYEKLLSGELEPEMLILDDLQGVKQLKFRVPRVSWTNYGLGNITLT